MKKRVVILGSILAMVGVGIVVAVIAVPSSPQPLLPAATLNASASQFSLPQIVSMLLAGVVGLAIALGEKP